MYDSSGNRLRSADVWVAANGKTAQFINELFPEYFVPGLESSGQVTVRSVRTSNSSGPVTDAEKIVVGALEIGPQSGDFSAIPLR